MVLIICSSINSYALVPKKQIFLSSISQVLLYVKTKERSGKTPRDFQTGKLDTLIQEDRWKIQPYLP